MKTYKGDIKLVFPDQEKRRSFMRKYNVKLNSSRSISLVTEYYRSRSTMIHTLSLNKSVMTKTVKYWTHISARYGANVVVCVYSHTVVVVCVYSHTVEDESEYFKGKI